MARESTLRGSGPVAPGPLLATWQMMEWIRDNGPADRDTIKDACAGFVDPGYARRWYQQKRNAPGNAKRTLTTQKDGSAGTLADIPLDAAQGAVIVKLLGRAADSATYRGNPLLRRDEDGLYHILRMPKQTPAGLTVEQVTSDPTVQARHVYEMELVRRLRAANTRGALDHNRTRLLRKEVAALVNWLGTFDDVDQQTLTQVQLEATAALRGYRDRIATNPGTRARHGEKDAIRALWLALDRYAPAPDPPE